MDSIQPIDLKGLKKWWSSYSLPDKGSSKVWIHNPILISSNKSVKVIQKMKKKQKYLHIKPNNKTSLPYKQLEPSKLRSKCPPQRLANSLWPYNQAHKR